MLTSKSYVLITNREDLLTSVILIATKPVSTTLVLRYEPP